MSRPSLAWTLVPLAFLTFNVAALAWAYPAQTLAVLAVLVLSSAVGVGLRIWERSLDRRLRR